MADRMRKIDELSVGKEMTAAFRAAAAEAEAAVKEYCEVRSPVSRMQDEIGETISRGFAEGILAGAGMSGTMETGARNGGRVGGTESGSGGKNVTQYIYLRDSDASPYRTARRIRRESEVIFRN